MPPPAPIITLTTDFGLTDGYVAAIKGVILCRAPATTIVDLCHAVPPQDIMQAAYIIKDTFPYFPAGTIHVVVVDPGVGSERGIIVLAAQGHLFLGPDNGVFSLLINPEAQAFLTDRPDLHRQPVSRTFHGRDIMAPLAAHLAAGHSLDSLGSPMAPCKLVCLQPPAPAFNPVTRQLHGRIIRIDHFGNLITNISRDDVEQLAANSTALRLTIGPHDIRSWRESYSQAPPGQPLALINSAGFLEIAINHGHAANHLTAKIYDSVILSVC